MQLIGGNLDEVRKERQVIQSKISKIDEEIKVIDNDIKSLQEELQATTQKRETAYESIQKLRKQRDEGVHFFLPQTNKYELFSSCGTNWPPLFSPKAMLIYNLSPFWPTEVESFYMSWHGSFSVVSYANFSGLVIWGFGFKH